MAKFTPALALVFCLSGLVAAQETSKPLGKWERKIDKKLVTLTVEENRLHLTIQDEKPRTAHADYSITKDGIVYGVVTSVECDEDDTAEAEDDASKILDAPFSCRFRIDEGALIVRDLKFQDMGTKDDPWNGRFKAVSQAPVRTSRLTPPLPAAGNVGSWPIIQCSAPDASDYSRAGEAPPAFVPESAKFFLPSPEEREKIANMAGYIR